MSGTAQTATTASRPYRLFRAGKVAARDLRETPANRDFKAPTGLEPVLPSARHFPRETDRPSVLLAGGGVRAVAATCALTVRGVLLFWAVAILLGTVAASWVGDRIA